MQPSQHFVFFSDYKVHNIQPHWIEEAKLMMSMETRHACKLNYDSEDEEISGCTCFLTGFRRNQVLDYNKVSEMVIEDSEELFFEINLMKDTIIEEDCESSVFSFDIHNNEDDIVYVAVGDAGESSFEALLWTLNHLVTTSTTVCLVHVFPQIRLIPTPFGKIPKSHVDPEEAKRKMLLERFIHLCTDSKVKVKVEIMLIEGDNVAKAIVELVRNLGIRKLVIGTTKSNLRMSSKIVSKRRNSIADKVLKDAPEVCDVKIICGGKEVIDDQMFGCTTTTSCYSENSSPRVSQENELHSFLPLLRFLHKNPIWLFKPRF